MTGGVTVGRDGAVSTGGRAERCEAAGLRVSWVGVAFVPGQPAGRPSIARFAERAAGEGVAPAVDALRGQYFAAVETGAETLAFVDPSGYFHAFPSPDGAAEDF